MKNHPVEESSGKVAAWMVTFADLMALMMTFFVLLYSLSKIDEEKYKSIVDSMAKGFDGVQWIKQRLLKDDFIGPEPGIIPAPVIPKNIQPVPEPESVKEEMRPVEINARTLAVDKKLVQSEVLFKQLTQDLEKEIAAGLIIVELHGGMLVIRFPESVSFTSGSDLLVKDFIPVLHRISSILQSSKGKIIVAGHTDDRPIATERFRSNWELSAARAVSVAHRLLETRAIDSSQLVVAGHADTLPLEPNDSADHRAKNRRVEISVIQ